MAAPTAHLSTMFASREKHAAPDYKDQPSEWHERVTRRECRRRGAATAFNRAGLSLMLQSRSGVKIYRAQNPLICDEALTDLLPSRAGFCVPIFIRAQLLCSEASAEIRRRF